MWSTRVAVKYVRNPPLYQAVGMRRERGGGRRGRDPMWKHPKALLNPSARSEVPPFMVMDVMAAAARIEAGGGRVIHMEVGQPAAAPPASAIAAARAALLTGRLGYTETLGIAPLRARISRHYRES